MNTAAQICMAIAISIGTIGAMQKAMVYQFKFAPLVAFGVMRLIQPLFNYLESLVGRSSKMGNIIVFVFLLFVTLGMQVIIGITLAQPYQNQQLVRKMMRVSHLMMIIELGVWDTIVMPIIMALVGSCGCGQKLFGTLGLRVPPCGK